MYDLLRPRSSGIAVASTVALLMSGCDGVGPSPNDTSAESGELPDPRLSYREDGVVLSKNASRELADFVGSVQFDAVFPMSMRIRALDPTVKKGVFKQLLGAQKEVEAAMRAVEAAGDEPSPPDLNRLDRANAKIQRILKRFISDDESQRLHGRAEALVEKYPFLKGLSNEQIESILWQAFGTVSKDRQEPMMWVPTVAAGDTGEGDNCNLDCAVTAAFTFAAIELGFAGATAGCIATTIGIVPCMGWAFGTKFLALGRLTWGVYTCTKKCN